MNPLAPLRPLGAVLTPALVAATRAALEPLALPPDPQGRALYDLAYGPHPRHRLDLFLPPSGQADTLLVYVHGGGFVAGDKGGEGAPFFRNWGGFAQARGWAGCALTYRLAPEIRWPAGAEDIALALQFLAQGAGQGLAPRRILLAGQSAGAIHAADALAGRGGPLPGALKGAVLMSGLYDFTRHARLGFEGAYQGDDPGPQSTLAALADQPVPLMFTLSELDPPAFQRQAALLVDHWTARHGHWPRLHWLEGHNHVSPAMQLGAAGDTLGPLIDAFAATLD